jgi:hypothetical protein
MDSHEIGYVVLAVVSVVTDLALAWAVVHLWRWKRRG